MEIILPQLDPIGNVLIRWRSDADDAELRLEGPRVDVGDSRLQAGVRPRGLLLQQGRMQRRRERGRCGICIEVKVMRSYA